MDQDRVKSSGHKNFFASTTDYDVDGSCKLLPHCGSFISFSDPTTMKVLLFSVVQQQ
jgi:hypothetical protein